MAAKVGTSNVLFRVGSGSPSKVFLGSEAVQTVPGAPTMNDVCADANSTVTFFVPASDGGSPILGYDIWIDDNSYVDDWTGLQGFGQGFYPLASPSQNLDDTLRLTIEEGLALTEGSEFKIRAYNAIGYGPFSDGFLAVFC